VERLTGQARGADALVVDRMTIDPGTPRGPFHVHRHTSNTLVVLDGELEVRVPGGSHRLRTGDAIFLSAGHPHGTHNPGDGRVSVLVIYERTVDDDFDLAPEEPTQQVADLG
jgi:quercetin dioxygenase-like cupin family protein